MKLFTLFVAWQNYAASELAVASVEEERIEAALKFIEYQGMAMNWNTTADKKVTIARAEMLSSKEYSEAQQKYFNIYAQRKLTEAIYGNCERSAALISRELSRRLGQSPIERRNHRWNP